MTPISLRTAKQVVPMIYAYTTPEIKRHYGWTKIGYTEQEVGRRLSQQTHTADVLFREEWKGNALFEDGSGEAFRDSDFHAYLSKLSVERNPGTEWFRVTGETSRRHFYDFRLNRGILAQLDAVMPYTLRAEQEEAVAKTAAYYEAHEGGEFLWNAKPRFGKTLSVYDFCRRVKARSVLIVTNRPAIANSWYDDYVRFVGRVSGYLFVSETDSLQGKKHVLSREQYYRLAAETNQQIEGRIEFLSLQDIKGSLYFGGRLDKLEDIKRMRWDILVVDEAHEGVDTYKTDVAFDQIRRRFTLHLSGTPFKALANDKFPREAIYNWTYADEQAAKRDFDTGSGEPNPYANLPKLNLYTYQLSEIVSEELQQGMDLDGENYAYAFNLMDFFATKSGAFEHDSSVDRFLEALTKQTKFPFSTEALRSEIRHSFWLLDRVDSVKALAKKLEAHPVFSQYKIIIAAGKPDDSEDSARAFDRVRQAIAENDRTITLSVGQLTTGVTIPEWSAVLMLANVRSPSLYMQAAFRAQNPCLFKSGTQFLRKENAYVFDFDPARTLITFEKFANDLSEETADGRGDSQTRKQNIRRLLNFFPVIGEDEEGEMVELDAEKVLSIPRKVRSQEVVRRGFMCDYLFQNISNIFRAPQAVLDILEKLPAVQAPTPLPVESSTAEELSLDENGEVSLSEEWVIGQAKGLFGEKLYEEDMGEKLKAAIEKLPARPEDPDSALLDNLKEIFHRQAVAPMLSKAEEAYTGDLKTAEKNRLNRKLTTEADSLVGRAFGDYSIKQKELEQERKNMLSFSPAQEADDINRQYDQLQKEEKDRLTQTLTAAADDFAAAAGPEIVRTVETSKKEAVKTDIEEGIRDRLRGFSRTIPSFLMAYGSDEVTLESFDTIIPGDVFLEVTSLTLDQFLFLRDGGPYTDPETGEEKHYEGHLFDPVVFNDSVKEFMRLRTRLANYFDPANKEDIFDYIPPQRNNQIFTPKKVVQRMVDLLEEENPGCFDDPDKTFIDLYMKSGMYITEIVKRLYRSKKLQALYPDDAKRLNHIFEKQVYGLAPTEIIYRIALSYILGFAADLRIEKNNLRKYDSLPAAKAGTLEAELDKLFNSDEEGAR